MITKSEAINAMLKAVTKWVTGSPAEYNDRQMAIHCVSLDARKEINQLMDAPPLKEIVEVSTNVEVPAPFKPVTIDAIEQQHVLAMLEYTEWNKSRAAELLGIERSTLDRKLKRYEVVRPRPTVITNNRPADNSVPTLEANA